jgi:hypothetical protein
MMENSVVPKNRRHTTYVGLVFSLFFFQNNDTPEIWCESENGLLDITCFLLSLLREVYIHPLLLLANSIHHTLILLLSKRGGFGPMEKCAVPKLNSQDLM